MKKKYEKPKARAVRIACRCTLLAGSTEAGLQGSATLGESWTDSGKDTVYLTIPAGQYTGAQTLVYKSGDKEESETLSATKATFKAGETYSRTSIFGSRVTYVATTSDWSSVISAFNAEETPNPLLRLECDITTTYITITRADGEIELNGHTVLGVYARNNILDKTLVIENGTVTHGIDGYDGQGTYCYGTVMLENVDCGNIWNDGHKYVINSGTYGLIEMTGEAPYPSIVNIYGGYFKNIYRRFGTASAILYGGKYSFRPEDSWCASGYSVKANTDADSATYPYKVSAD
ncbi:MAG: hypothetical protein IJ782_01535 [Prevotella sp.]|nr:hypothetical protein [Prevotella sp.]